MKSPKQAGEAVSLVHNSGADFVKVYEDIPIESLEIISKSTRNLGLHFSGHVSEETQTITEAILLGQRSIEHIRSHLLLCFADNQNDLEELYSSDDWNESDKKWAEPHLQSCEDMWPLLRTSETWITPTLAVQETLEIGSEDWFINDKRRESLPESINKSVESRGKSLKARTTDELDEIVNWNKFIHRFVSRAAQEESNFLSGSDAACEGVLPGYGLHRELELMVSAGLTELKALQSATLEPSKYLSKSDQIGQVKEGYVADLVILEMNPLDDISNTSEIFKVILNGSVVNLSE